MTSKILYVEDDAKNIELIRAMLEMVDCELLEAGDSNTAFEIAVQEKPDLILMDIYLPGPSGIDIIQQFKQSPSLRHIPVIAITADDSEKTKQRCFEVGCVDIIYKPVKRFILLDGVRRYTNLNIEAPAMDDTADGAKGIKRVLIAEDNPDLRVIFARTFDSRYFSVHVAADGAEAIEYLQDELPDVLILDINMPRISGFEVLRYVRENQRTKDIKVVVVTGNVTAMQAPEAEFADLLLVKPVDISDLVTLAQRLSTN